MGESRSTQILAKVGQLRLAKVGQNFLTKVGLAKVGLAKVGLSQSEGSLLPLQDSLPDAGEAINDVWSMSGNFIYRHHVEPRVKLYSPREESFPLPLKCIDVFRTLLIRIWMSSKNSASMIIGISMGLETCQILGQVSHNLLNWKKNLPTDTCGRVGNWTASDIQARSFMARTLERINKKC